MAGGRQLLAKRKLEMLVGHLQACNSCKVTCLYPGPSLWIPRALPQPSLRGLGLQVESHLLVCVVETDLARLRLSVWGRVFLELQRGI